SFSWFVHSRHLPSFPTRRSSDLWLLKVWGGRWQLGSHDEIGLVADGVLIFSIKRQQFRVLRIRHVFDKIGGRDRSNLKRDSLVRSEEHTSELQSRENLVCRRLLE